MVTHYSLPVVCTCFVVSNFSLGCLLAALKEEEGRREGGGEREREDVSE